MRLLPIVLVTLLALQGCGSSPGAAMAPAPDAPVVLPPAPVTPATPLARFDGAAPAVDVPGPFTVSAPRDYDLGQYLVSDGDNDLAYNADVHGAVRAPTTGAGPFPVILFLHGRHVTCSYGGFEFLSAGICPEIDGLVLQIKTVPSSWATTTWRLIWPRRAMW